MPSYFSYSTKCPIPMEVLTCLIHLGCLRHQTNFHPEDCDHRMRRLSSLLSPRSMPTPAPPQPHCYKTRSHFVLLRLADGSLLPKHGQLNRNQEQARVSCSLRIHQRGRCRYQESHLPQGADQKETLRQGVPLFCRVVSRIGWQ